MNKTTTRYFQQLCKNLFVDLHCDLCAYFVYIQYVSVCLHVTVYMCVC